MSTARTPFESDLDARLALERVKSRKLEILFGPWWRHYAVPYEFRLTLYGEHQRCPYCGGPLGPLDGEGLGGVGDAMSAHLDHMDPLSRGGEDSIRNALYVCAACNLRKRDRLFRDWLQRLAPEHREGATTIYVAKHGHAPEAFVPGRRQVRLTQPRLELQLDESVLRRLFPHPIVDGPPRTQPAMSAGSARLTQTRRSPP